MSNIVDVYSFGTVSLDIKALDFEERFEDSEIGYVLFPKNPAAAAPLYEYFPPEEWKYRFLVKKNDTAAPQGCNILYIRVDSETDRRLLDFDTMTEEDYEYLTGLFGRLFPEMSIMTPEQLQEKRLGDELWNLSFAEAPVEPNLKDCIHSLVPADYALLKEHFLKRKEDYIIPGSVDIDYKKLYEFINSEFIEALLQKAERESGRQDGFAKKAKQA